MSLDGLVDAVWRSLGKVEKGMILLTLVLYIGSALYSSTARVKVFKSIEIGSFSLVRISLLILSGIFLGSFVGTFLPREFVSQLLGKESGFYGILLGTVFGAVMPGGPYVIFPIVSSLFASGASVPPLIAMIFAWQCISLTRIPTDLGYLAVVEGEKLVWVRVILGVPIPVIAGFLASIIWRTR
jgi:uncharacterized membrane protein YraQ (UPF0718 family)